MHCDKFIALIPARAGSKRLRHKHLRPLAHQPLIHYSFEAAKQAALLEAVYVSTDCPIISKLALNNSLKLAHDNGLRPAKLAEDTTASIDVIRAFIHWYQDTIANEAFNLVLLQPTSPLRQAADIQAACHAYTQQARGTSLISVSPSKPLQWQGWVSTNGVLNGLKTEERYSGLSTAGGTIRHHHVQLNGAIYIANSQALLKFNFLEMPAYAHVMKAFASVDIDTAEDLHLAEALLRVQQHTVVNEQRQTVSTFFEAI